MNKNEKNQLEMFRTFVMQEKDEKGYFYGAISVNETFEPYDAVVEFENKKIYVQLTTMSNLVGKNRKDKIITHRKSTNKLKWTDSQTEAEKDKKRLNKRNIEREIIKCDGGHLHVRDNYNTLLDEEEDLDKKHNIKSGHLINAIVRTIKLKSNKKTYISKDKKMNSTLVILDESPNVFKELPIVNFGNWTSKDVKRYKGYSVSDFLKHILNLALNESKLTTFFDDIIIYFKKIGTSNDPDDLWNLIVHTENNDKFPAVFHSKFIVMTIKSSYKFMQIIDNKDI